MNKGYAFGFLLILLVLILGFYVAYTGFVSGRETLRAQRSTARDAQMAQATGNPTSPDSRITSALAFTPTSPLSHSEMQTPGITATVAITITPGLASPTQTTEPPTAPATQPPTAPIAQPTNTALPPSQPATTPTPPASEGESPPAQPQTPMAVPAHQYRLAGPPASDPEYPICCYIYGTVRDAVGNGLEGVQVQVANEWNPPIVALTKGGNELGKYDIPINASVVNWEIALVDTAGTLISTKVQIQFDASVTNGYRVEWQRTY